MKEEIKRLFKDWTKANPYMSINAYTILFNEWLDKQELSSHSQANMVKAAQEMIEKYNVENKLVIYDDDVIESDKFQLTKMLTDFAHQFQTSKTKTLPSDEEINKIVHDFHENWRKQNPHYTEEESNFYWSGINDGAYAIKNGISQT